MFCITFGSICTSSDHAVALMQQGDRLSSTLQVCREEFTALEKSRQVAHGAFVEQKKQDTQERKATLERGVRGHKYLFLSWVFFFFVLAPCAT